MPAWEFLTCMGVFLVILTHGGVFWAAFDLWGSLQWCMIRWGKSSFHDSWGGYLGNFRLTGKSLMMLRKNLGNFWLTGKPLMMYNPLGKDSFFFFFFFGDSLGSLLVVLTHEGVFLVISNPPGKNLGIFNSWGSFLGDFYTFQPSEGYFCHFGESL